MLGSFKIRVLLVIVVVAMLGLIMQSDHESKRAVEPVLKYIMTADYQSDLDKKLSAYFDRGGESQTESLESVIGTTLLHMPCEFLEVEKNYGWHFRPQGKQQEFNPGIYLRVKDNTVVQPIMEGQVVNISRDANNGIVLIKHREDFYSVYGGLKEVLVEKSKGIDTDTVLGKTGKQFYFEVRTSDGPVDPHSIFK